MRTHLCLLALAAALPGAARAADTTVAVVPLDAPPDLKFTGKSVAEAVAKELASAGGFRVIGPAQVEEKLGRDATQALVRCADDAKCVGDRGGKLAADRIVAGWLLKKGDAYRAALVSVDGKSGARLGGLEREIPVASRRLQKDLAAAAPALVVGQRDATGLLKVVTAVPGALVTIDDVPVGATPIVRSVKPGKHKVHVSRTGWVDAEPSWVEVPANGVVEHRPRLYEIPARDRPNQSVEGGTGTKVQVSK